MSWHYLRGLGGGYLEDICSGGELCAPLKSKTTHAEFYSNGKLTEYYLDSLYGMMCAHSMENNGEEELTSSPGVFPVKMSALPEMEKDLKGSIQGFGQKWPASLAKYDQDSHSWKTAQLSLLGGLEPFSETWPKWGIMQDGESWELPTLAQNTKETECGYLPTPTKHNAKELGAPSQLKRNTIQLGDLVAMETDGGKLAPEYSESLMLWPIGWTDLKPLEMGKFQRWRRLHSLFCHKDSPTNQAPQDHPDG